LPGKGFLANQQGSPIMPCKLVTAVIALAISATVAHSQTQGPIRLGTLTCTGGAGVGLILGSQKTYDCNFTPAANLPAENYAATVTRIGIDIGVTGQTTMVWTVLSATSGRGAGLLRGNYVGAAADAAVGIGVGAKVLVGGSNRAITLQPLSVQGQTGVNLAVGVAELSIR
jgi:hypothetical protein